jgi:MFS transporter, Spinster family, sphingosine-1-phosphate transporter
VALAVIRRPLTLLILLTGLNLLNYLDRMVLSAVLPRIEGALHLSHFVGGSLATVFLVGYFLTSPIFGTLADRGRRTYLIAAGVAVWSLATFASGLATGATSLIIARVFVGVGEASYATIAPTIIDDIAPHDKKGKWLAIFFAASPIGSALGYFTGGIADKADKVEGWRHAFWVAGLPGVLLAGLCLLIVDPPRQLHHKKESLLAAAKELVPMRIFRRGVLGYCAYTFAIGGFAYWAPTFLFNTYGLSLAKANLYFGAITVVAGAIGTMLGGAWGDRAARVDRGEDDPDRNSALGYLRVCAITTAIGAPIAMACFFANSYQLFFALVFPCEIALFMSTSPINAVILRSVPAPRRASAVALAIFAIHLFGDLWSPPLIGKLADAMPMRIAMMMLPIAFGIGALVWWLPGRRAARAVAIGATGLLAAGLLAACSHVATSASPSGGQQLARAQPASQPLPFVEDDYGRALAAAKASHRPLFVDAWAPWCHSCMSLRSFVFPRPAMQKKRERFVWLAVDTDKPENAAFVSKFEASVLPTLWVIDPETETPLLKWPGTLTAEELAALLDEVADAYAAGGEALARLRSGATSRNRDRIVEAEILGLAEAKDHAACATRAAEETGRLQSATARADVAVTGASAAIELAPASAVRSATLPKLVAALEAIAADRKLPLVADDRSGVYEALVAALKAEPATARRALPVARAWADFLEAEAAKAPDPVARAVFDPHRLGAYLELGEPERAIPMLEASARDLPRDYNPHARLARAFLELKRYDDAVAAVDRALRLAYGSRKLKIHLLKADILAKKNDRAAEKAALEQAIADAGGLALSDGYKRLVAAMRTRADRLQR